MKLLLILNKVELIYYLRNAERRAGHEWKLAPFMLMVFLGGERRAWGSGNQSENCNLLIKSKTLLRW